MPPPARPGRPTVPKAVTVAALETSASRLRTPGSGESRPTCLLCPSRSRLQAPPTACGPREDGTQRDAEVAVPQNPLNTREPRRHGHLRSTLYVFCSLKPVSRAQVTEKKSNSG